MVVGEKNRCILVTGSEQRNRPSLNRLCELAGTISGTTMGTIGSA
jgi:hypothetical protein